MNTIELTDSPLETFADSLLKNCCGRGSGWARWRW
jgi:hypothetical protein